MIGLLLSQWAQAGIVTKVVHIEDSNDGKKIEVFATHEGRVYEVNAKNLNVLADLKEAVNSGNDVELDLNETNVSTSGEITSVKLVAMGEMPQSLSDEEGLLNPLTGYTPSNVSSVEEAQKVFSSLNGKTKMFSQCFNRAHIWAKQMYDNFGISSEKILIYYTSKYRREVNGRWWFHIAPMVSVNGERYVMDRSFTDAPVTTAQWEGIFNKLTARTGYRCTKIKNISEYFNEKNMQNDYCNIQHTSMFYWEPNDMIELEKTGVQKLGWIDWEIKAAAREAFKRWRSVYKAHTTDL